MCGLAGIFTRRSQPVHVEILNHMTDALRHRGPDDRGIWFDREAGIWLGHRRLSIIDLSPAGSSQPMISESGRSIIVFNGEIYNHAELRHELELAGQRFRGHSDTEVLLHGIEHWGLHATLRKARGMFALAVWDRSERILSLARDRFGEKPLYVGIARGELLFASELQSFRAHPAFDRTIDERSVAAFLGHGAVPARRPSTARP